MRTFVAALSYRIFQVAENRFDRSLYLIISLTAFFMLATQVTLTRLLSVTLYYHYAFATISLLMLGLTIAALKVFRDPDYFSAANAHRVVAGSLVRFAVYMWLMVLTHVIIPAQWLSASALSVNLLWILSSVFALYAFVSLGVIISILLTRFPFHSGRLYAADLIGASLGCIGIWLAMRQFDPIGLLLLFASAALWAAWCYHRRWDLLKQLTVSALIVLSSGLTVMQVQSYAKGDPMWRVGYVMTGRISEPDVERWNTYSRIAITPLNELSQYMTIDIDAGTVIHKFDGNEFINQLLRQQVANISYFIRSPSKVAVIGVGGGRDVHSALVFGVQRVDGIEMNPITLELLNGAYGEFSGHLDRNPAVRFINAEARSYLGVSREQYDMIQISLIDTWAATAAGGLTLSENKLYTVEAWQEFMDRLSHGGMLSITRWFEKRKYPAEFYRLVALAQKTVENQHIALSAKPYVLAAADMSTSPEIGGIATMLLSKRPFTEAEINSFEQLAADRGYTVLLSPRGQWDHITSFIADGAAKSYFAQLPVDVTPPTDDRPFFFYMERLADLFVGAPFEKGDNFTMNYKNNMAVRILFGILSLTFFAAIWLIGKPMLELYERQKSLIHGHKRDALFFAMIGLGYMLIEIASMQRLGIFLGHPAYGLTVVLFTMLLFSGLGSLASGSVLGKRLGGWTPVALTLALFATHYITGETKNYLRFYGIETRIIFSVLLLAPISFFMGMMFPLGVAGTRETAPSLLPWFWGINGAFSVFGSVLAVAWSIQFGISNTFLLGIACYCICGLCMRRRVIAA